MSDDPGFFGQQRLDTNNTDFNRQSFMIRMLLNQTNTATLVQVKAVAPSAMTVDVLPLVTQVAGDGTAIPHTTVYGVPFLRNQGGVNALLCDPQVGDIGLCVFADHDLSSVKATNAQASPGSHRRFDMADGLYVMGWNVSTTPTRYVKLSNAGIVVKASEDVDVQAPALNTTTAFKVGGTKVVGTQQAAINNPAGGSTVDTQARVAINAILTALAAHGLIA